MVPATAITMETVDKFLTRMYHTSSDFAFTVTRAFVRNCQTPVLIRPDDIPVHLYAVAVETAMPALKAEVSMFPRKELKERIPLAVRQIRSFSGPHRPTSAQRRPYDRAAASVLLPRYRTGRESATTTDDQP